MGQKDYIATAAQYQADVLDGSIPACKWVRLACGRNRRDLDRQETEAFPYYFDPAAGAKVCQMAEMLPHVKSYDKIVGEDEEGRPVWKTISLEPWQCWFFATLFGWLNKSDGLRRFRIAFLLVPRKNSKSTMGAIVALYMLVADGIGESECYSAATTRDQAKVIAEIAWLMVQRSPAFREHFGVKLGSATTRSLSVPAKGSKFMPLSADANSLDGLNISFAAVDELHAHRTGAVWQVIDTGTGARPQPLILATTTAGVDVGGICHQKLLYLEKLLDGTAKDERFFGINYTLDPGDDYRDPAMWRKANPNFGVSMTQIDLERKVAAAQVNQAEENNVLTKHFNVWIRTESSWMSRTLWQTCKVPGLTIEAFKAFPCWIGVDLAEVRDIAALVILFKTGPESYAMFGRYYLPEAAVDKSPVESLSGWVKEHIPSGWPQIIKTEGDTADFRLIQKDLLVWVEQFKVQEIDFDRALAAHMQQELKAILEPRMGKDAVDRLVITVPQDTPTMDRAMKMTERLVLGKHLQHDGNEAMAWMISNVVVFRSQSTDEIRPNKAGGKDSANKIDGPVALFTCLSQAMLTKDAPKPPQLIILGGKRA